MIPVADHQGAPPRVEPARGYFFAGPPTPASNPAASRGFAAVLAGKAEEDGNQPAKITVGPETAEEMPLDGTVAAGLPPTTATPTTDLVARTDTGGRGAGKGVGAIRVSGTVTLPLDDGSDSHPDSIPVSALLDDVSPKPRSATLHDAEAADAIARRDPAPFRSAGDGRGHGGGLFAAIPPATASASGEPISAVAEPIARPMGGDPLSDGQRPGSAQASISNPHFSGASGVVPGSAVMADDGSVAPPPPPVTTLPVAAALMPIMTALRMAEPLAGAGRGAAPATSGPRLASPAAASLPTLAQSRVSTTLATIAEAVSDPDGLIDSALGAPEHRGSALLATAHASPLAPAAPGQDIPRQIAVQIAQAAAGPGGARGTVELSLSPEELGRVRLRLHPSEAGLSVTITADRPETLDLMRRNIDLLAREFLDIGYEGAQFEFAQSGQRADKGADNGQSTPPAIADPANTVQRANIAQPEPAVRIMLGDRLDIRL